MTASWGITDLLRKDSANGANVFNFGMVDTEEKGREAGEFFNKNNVDIVFSHAGNLLRKCNSTSCSSDQQCACYYIKSAADCGNGI